MNEQNIRSRHKSERGCDQPGDHAQLGREGLHHDVHRVL